MSRRNANGEGSIWLRKDGRWCAGAYVRTVGNRVERRYVYGRTRKEVVAKLVDLRSSHTRCMNCANWFAASATISRNADSICACTFAVLAVGRYRSTFAAVAAGSSTVVDMSHPFLVIV